jgi:hypothetical protein
VTWVSIEFSKCLSPESKLGVGWLAFVSRDCSLCGILCVFICSDTNLMYLSMEDLLPEVRHLGGLL